METLVIVFTLWWGTMFVIHEGEPPEKTQIEHRVEKMGHKPFK